MQDDKKKDKKSAEPTKQPSTESTSSADGSLHQLRRTGTFRTLEQAEEEQAKAKDKKQEKK